MENTNFWLQSMILGEGTKLNRCGLLGHFVVLLLQRKTKTSKKTESEEANL